MALSGSRHVNDEIICFYFFQRADTCRDGRWKIWTRKSDLGISCRQCFLINIRCFFFQCIVFHLNIHTRDIFFKRYFRISIKFAIRPDSGFHISVWLINLDGIAPAVIRNRTTRKAYLLQCLTARLDG